MTSLACLHCHAETTNGLALCARCLRTCSVALANTSAYYADLARIRPGQRVKARTAYRSTPPTDTSARRDRIADELDRTRALIVGWVRCLLDDRPELGPMPTDPPSEYGSLAHVVAWLDGRLTTVATLPWAGELVRTAINAERDLRRLVERTDTGWYAGRCGTVLSPAAPHSSATCGCQCHASGTESALESTHTTESGECATDTNLSRENDTQSFCDVDGEDGHGCHPELDLPETACDRPLYATPGISWITCTECGTTHNVNDRREQMITEARDELAPVRVIAKVAVGLTDEPSEERLTERIKKWVKHGRITPHGTKVYGGRPQQVYRIGDAFDLLTKSTKTAS